MKAILEFNLPEDKDEHHYALKGSRYKLALGEIDMYLRGRLKYESLSAPVYEALQDARTHLNELIREAEEL